MSGRMKTHRLETDKHLGMALRARRNELNLSQTNVGDALGCSWQLISRYELGKTGILVDTLCRLSAALYTTPDKLLAQAGLVPPGSAVGRARACEHAGRCEHSTRSVRPA